MSVDGIRVRLSVFIRRLESFEAAINIRRMKIVNEREPKQKNTERPEIWNRLEDGINCAKVCLVRNSRVFVKMNNKKFIKKKPGKFNKNRGKFTKSKDGKPQVKKSLLEDDEITKLRESYEKLPDFREIKSFDNFPLSRKTKKGLLANKFRVPTEIQKQSIGPALLGKDILGAAQTGSGKTLGKSR